MTREELVAAGYPKAAEAQERLSAFVALLLEENQRMNLTAVRDAHTLWRVHVCDSLELLRVLGHRRPLQLLDIGTGGGLPGVPLACVDTAIRVTLLDARRKKVAALERIIAALRLTGVRAVWGRAEQLTGDPAHRGRYDVVTARAVTRLARLLEYAPAFLRPSDPARRIWLFKSLRALGAEIHEALPVIGRAKLQPLEPVRYRLPGDTHDRLLLGYAPALQ